MDSEVHCNTLTEWELSGGVSVSVKSKVCEKISIDHLMVGGQYYKKFIVVSLVLDHN